MFDKRKISVICFAVALAMFGAGCKKKVPAAAPPPPPQPQPVPEAPRPPAPAVSFSAEPTSIQRGQSSTLRWQVSGATSVSLDQGVGAVQNAGNRRVTPDSSTTYTLTATGPGGTTTGQATVSVTSAPPPPPPPPPSNPSRSLDQRLTSEIQDAYFDYDKSDIRGDARDVLTRNAAALRSILTDFPSASIVVEGHCDERGSAEYNLGLGDRRATAAKDFLVGLGVPGDRLKTISYGKERPQCTEQNESCWQKNRRAHFAPGQ